MLRVNKQDLYRPLAEFWQPWPDFQSLFQPWREEKFFNLASQSASPPVVVFTLIEFLKQTFKCDGAVAEFGVWKGGTARIIAKHLTGRSKTLHLLDTFTGIPETSEKDNFWEVGAFGKRSGISFERIQEEFGAMNFVKIHKGKFDDTLKKIENEKFSFVHVDCDTYKSIMQVSEFIYPRMNKGGIIVYDDYGDFVSKGAKKAVDEFYQDNLVYLPTKQAIILC